MSAIADLHRRLARELARVSRTHAELAEALEREETDATAEPERPPIDARETARLALRRAGIRTKTTA